MKKENLWYSRLYRQWKAMRYSCTRPNYFAYKKCGALGISYPTEWNSYIKFKEWAFSSGYEEGNTLRRKDATKNFSPQNCIWSNSGMRHGMSNTPIYYCWRCMLERCYDPKHNSYKDYGGRGITVVKEWHEFLPFMKWALSNGYKEGLTLDRINNDGIYEPNNCRWATAIQQCNNRRSSVTITYNGSTHTIAEWARIVGVGRGVIWKRLQQKLPTSEVLRSQKHAHRGENHFGNLITYKGTTLNQKQWAEKVGISPTSLGRRLKQMSIEEALTKPKKR